MPDGLATCHRALDIKIFNPKALHSIEDVSQCGDASSIFIFGDIPKCLRDTADYIKPARQGFTDVQVDVQDRNLAKGAKVVRIKQIAVCQLGCQISKFILTLVLYAIDSHIKK
jgi:hypothetical protein